MKVSNYLNEIKKILDSIPNIRTCILKISYDGIGLYDINNTELSISSNTCLLIDEIEKEANPEFLSSLMLANVKFDEVFIISRQLYKLRLKILDENNDKGRVGINRMLKEFDNYVLSKS
jgi:hypothetical protein